MITSLVNVAFTILIAIPILQWLPERDITREGQYNALEASKQLAEEEIEALKALVEAKNREVANLRKVVAMKNEVIQGEKNV